MQFHELVCSSFLCLSSSQELCRASFNVNTFKAYDSPELKFKYVRIIFYATTFDRITKDRAAKFVDMLSAIGGTMGLLTGFSIISAVEIVYFAFKIMFNMKMN